jgi:hypothetical protein
MGNVLWCSSEYSDQKCLENGFCSKENCLEQGYEQILTTELNELKTKAEKVCVESQTECPTCPETQTCPACPETQTCPTCPETQTCPTCPETPPREDTVPGLIYISTSQPTNNWVQLSDSSNIKGGVLTSLTLSPLSTYTVYSKYITLTSWGVFVPPTSGNYTFRTKASGKITLSINNTKIINNVISGETFRESTPIFLEMMSGYPIQIQLQKGAGTGDIAHIQYKVDNGDFKDISSELFHLQKNSVEGFVHTQNENINIIIVLVFLYLIYMCIKK